MPIFQTIKTSSTDVALELKTFIGRFLLQVAWSWCSIVPMSLGQVVGQQHVFNFVSTIKGGYQSQTPLSAIWLACQHSCIRQDPIHHDCAITALCPLSSRITEKANLQWNCDAVLSEENGYIRELQLQLESSSWYTTEISLKCSLKSLPAALLINSSSRLRHMA